MNRQPANDRRNPSRDDRRKEWSRGGRRATDNNREPRWFAPRKPAKQGE
jgi:hypothetical protein